jgi:hypothetical protein
MLYKGRKIFFASKNTKFTTKGLNMFGSSPIKLVSIDLMLKETFMIQAC